MDTAGTSRPIVVGYDHSTPSAAALDWAGRLAAGSGASVRVVHASEISVYAEEVSRGLTKPTREREFAERFAQKGVDRLSSVYPALEVEAVGSILSAAEALDEASKTASIVVVGSHGRGQVSSVLLGSTAYALSGYARCPVIVVRNDQAPLPGPKQPIVVGSDGSVSANHAIDAAADMAQRYAAPLVVVSSWTPPPPDPWERPPPGYQDFAAALKAREDQARAANLESINRVHTEFADLEVHGSVIEARPEDAIMHASPVAAILILGSRGHKKFMDMLLGSTSRAVLHQSTTPVMIVR